MRKRIFSVCLLLALVATLFAGCGSEKMYGDYTKDELRENLEYTVEGLTEITADELLQYIYANETQGNDLGATLLQNWYDVSTTQGDFIGFSDFSVDQTGKTYTCKLNLVFSDRDAVLTAVFTAYNMEMESITIEPIYTVSEKMSKAGLNTIMGIGIVFVMLAVISLVIKAFELINKAQTQGSTKKAPEPAVVPGPIQLPAEAEDDELVAVIAAAIAAATGRTTDDFVVRTIKRR